MPTIDQLKEQETPPTPLFLFDCKLSSGQVERWSTHAVTVGGNLYSARLLQHNLFVLQSSSDDGLDAPQKITATLANADSHYSQLERQTGFKGAQVTISFLFYDLASASAASELRVIFRGVGNPPEEITESAFRVTFTSRLSLQRVILPEVQIERRCPWTFPATAQQRADALSGGANGKYSAAYRCGYSADQPSGVGNLNGAAVFTSCDYTRSACQARGMFNVDAANHPTARFGGVEYVPAQIQVRSYGEKGSHLSPLVDNQARYSDFVPLVYGTAWYRPPIVFSRNDGNLTRLEVLLGMGEIAGVIKVIANGVEIPLGQSGVNMTATGWYNLITAGTRTGAFDYNFTDGQGNPLGDPYGDMAMLSVVLPNQISNGDSLPKISVLVNGIKLEAFDSVGASLGESFTNNPAWVLLDVLRRSGWLKSELDLLSFAAAAQYLGAAITTKDLYGNNVVVPRFECNLVIQNRRSAAEVVKGIRNGSMLLLRYGRTGLLRLDAENTFALQQPTQAAGGNGTQTLNGGWPAYEFGDTAATGGIARRSSGEPTLRLWARSGADTPNRLTVEFQDEFNQYQQDSLSLVDATDSTLTSREVTAAFPAVGVANFDQAARVLRLQLAKTLVGYTFVEFETSVRGVGLAPGDLITVTYGKEGLSRQPFRVVRLVPAKNYLTVQVTAQWHDDAWYGLSGSDVTGGQPGGNSDATIPRPLIGSVLDAHGIDQFGITESVIQGATGSAVALNVSFITPTKPSSTSAAIPLLSLSPTLAPTGGTIAGNQNLYYAVTAVDASGGESGLSFVVRASIPSGTSTNQVTLLGLTFSPGTTSFNVYRGTNPSELLRIASNHALAATFVDAGSTAQLVGPPDGNYDHANIYWRRELQPEVGADIFTSTTIGNSTLGMTPNTFAGAVARISRGTGAGQERTTTANTGTVLTITPAWTTTPDATSLFVVADSGWNFGAVGTSSPVQIQVPNWGGQTVQISARSANAKDQESPAGLNPLTDWQIGSGGVISVDYDVAPLPLFGLGLAGQGSVDLLGISFPSLTNTNTISAGTLTIYSWSELNPAPPVLAGGVAVADSTITLSATTLAAVNDSLQIDGEMLMVTGVQSGGTTLNVARAVHNSTATIHSAGASVYRMQPTSTSVSFIPKFFGTPASGGYLHSIYLPDVRIGAAEFYVTNSIGNSLVRHLSFGSTLDNGLRTLAGGQISLQVDGYLAIQTNATPPFIIEKTYAARDIFATVGQAPAGGSIQLTVRQNATTYCTLTIPDGATVSNIVNGFGLPPLVSNAQLNLDITSVPGAANTLPGSDLTVTIRL